MSLILDSNQAALAYWAATSYSDADIDGYFREIEGKYLFTKLIIGPDRALKFIASKRMGEIKQGHMPACMKFFRAVVNAMDPAAHGSCILWNEDALFDSIHGLALKVPMLAFARHVSGTQGILIPDPAFMDSLAYGDDFRAMDVWERDWPWEKKIPTAYWRGAASGPGIGLDSEVWREAPRVRLGLKSIEVANPALLDAYISKIDVFDQERFAERISNLGIVRDYLPFLEMLRYRYQIDIEGISCAWMSCFLKLASQAVVFKVHCDYAQWYYHALKPWEHYIPVARTLADLVEGIEWARAHDSACRTIAANARTFIRSITFDDSVSGTARILEALLRCQRG